MCNRVRKVPRTPPERTDPVMRQRRVTDNRMALLCAAALTFMLSACTGHADGSQASSDLASPNESATITPSSVELRGWPTRSLDCGQPTPLADGPIPHRRRFGSVTELLVCRYPHIQRMEKQITSTQLKVGDPGFERVMHALARPPALAPGEFMSCPAQPSAGPQLAIFANTPATPYFVLIPRGFCGWIQP